MSRSASAWPREFERERALLSRILSEVDATIEHVGSTAVPGLGAKPIIDIMVGTSALAEIESRIPELGVHGYEYVPEYEAQISERRFFRKSRKGECSYHLHGVMRDGAFWRRHLVFRDFLRGHPSSASAYYDLKRDLASRHGTDRVAYTEGKSSFVNSLLEKAAGDVAFTRSSGTPPSTWWNP